MAGRPPVTAGEDEYSEYVTLRFANVGAEPCTVEGPAELEFVDHEGQPLPMNVMENHAGPTSEPISLATRDGASQELYWNIQQSPCSEPAKVRVFPPNNTEPIVMDWNFGAICDGSRILNGNPEPS